MSSFSEAKARDLIEESAKDFVMYNAQQLSRIYPSGKRTGSSNYKPTAFWNVGCQIGTASFNPSVLKPVTGLGGIIVRFQSNCGLFCLNYIHMYSVNT
jgi:hypothetical protein